MGSQKVENRTCLSHATSRIYVRRIRTSYEGEQATQKFLVLLLVVEGSPFRGPVGLGGTSTAEVYMGGNR